MLIVFGLFIYNHYATDGGRHGIDKVEQLRVGTKHTIKEKKKELKENLAKEDDNSKKKDDNGKKKNKD
jgi:hypothetical protein